MGRGCSWRVFLTCWLVYCFFWTPYIVREHFPAITLAESGTLNVERYLGWTEDIFRGPKGGAFINNNPGASITGAVPLLLFRPLLREVERWNQSLPRPTATEEDGEMFAHTLREGRGVYFLLIAFLTVAFVMAPATAGTAAYLCSRLVAAGVPALSAAFCSVLYGLGTPVLFRVGHLNHNLLAGDAGFTALLLLWDCEVRPPSPLRAAGAGLLAGYTVLCDYSGVVIAATVAIYIWLRSGGRPPGERFRLLAFYAAGLAPMIFALAVYQDLAFGSFYRPSQHYMAPTAPTSQGYRGFDWPSPALLWANFFDPRFGLFAFCPALLLSLGVLFQGGRRFQLRGIEKSACFTYFFLFVLFCAANRYSWLQPSTGFRYLVPVVPVLAILSMQVAQYFKPLLRRLLAVGCFAQSLIMAASHENDVRLELAVLWHRRFECLWMIRLRRAGVNVPAWWTPILYLVLSSLVCALWLRPAQRRSKLEVSDG